MPEQKVCPACGAENVASARFCRSCGAELPAEAAPAAAALGAPQCPSCGAEARPGTRFCVSCGAPLTGAAGGRVGRLAPWIGGAAGVAFIVIGIVAGLMVRGDDGDDGASATNLGGPGVVTPEPRGAGSSGGGSEFALLVSPFEDDSTLFTAVNREGQQLIFEGTRYPDGRIKELEKLTVPGAEEHYTVYFRPDSLVSRMEGVSSTTGESDALEFRYSSDSMIVDLFDSVEAATPADTVTFSVEDIPELGEVLAQASARRAPSGEEDPEAEARLLVADHPGLAAPGRAPDLAPAAADDSVQIRLETSVRTVNGQPVDGLDVWWAVNMPLEFLDCVLLQGGLAVPGVNITKLRRTHIESEATCREIAAGYKSWEFFQRSGRMVGESGGLYRETVTLTRPLTDDDIEDICAGAADTWNGAGTGLDVADLANEGISAKFKELAARLGLKAAGIALNVVDVMISLAAPGARDCVAMGRTREAAMSQPWTTWSNVLVGRQAWGGCEFGDPDFRQRSEEKTFTAAELVGEGAVTVNHEIVLTDLLEVRVTGPGVLAVGDNGTFTATRSGGTGFYYEHGWLSSPDEIVSETDDESVAIYSGKSISGGRSYGFVGARVEDSFGCHARQEMRVQVTDEKVATGAFQPPLDPGSSILANEITLRFPAEGGDVTGEWNLAIAIDLQARGYDCRFTQTTSGPLTGTYDGRGWLSGTTFATGAISGVSGCEEDVDLEQGSDTLEWSATFDGRRVTGQLGSIEFVATVPEE